MDEFELSSFHWPSISMVPSITTVSPSKLLISVGEEMEEFKSIFSGEIQGKILEIKHSLSQLTNVDDK